ncbi:MAG: non-ribosomal peptide synthetase, partial [Gammaproteobacteria bacterium]|nr:non-ribosomal peptide synthetase [Gammaproteobacteria bacterium]
HVQTRLPGYMVPSAVVLLEALPLTPNGKVDRAALPEPGGERQVGDVYVAPRSELEQRIAAIWCEVLSLDKVGIDDNFFELGGNSLLAMRARSLVGDRLGRQLPIVDLFGFPTVRALAGRCETLAADSAGSDSESLSRIKERARRSRTAVRRRGNRTMRETST